MSVTYERVNLSQVNFNMLKYNYSDGIYPRYPIIANLSTNPANDLVDAVRSNLFKTMLSDGIDNMNLYDYNQNVIGSISISQYIIQYVTYEQLNGYADEQTSVSDYPDFRNRSNATYGVKYKRIYVDPNYSHTLGIKATITLNGTTITRYLGLDLGAFEIREQYGTATAANVWRVLIAGVGIPPKTLGLMSRTIGGVEFKYLDIVTLGAVSGEYDYGIDSVEQVTALLADNLNITDYIVQEDGYVNELMNRFSPRLNDWGKGLGMYIVPYEKNDYGDIADVLNALMTQNTGDALSKTWLGSDGKDCVISIRWFYGLRKSQANVNISPNLRSIRVGALALSVEPVTLKMYNEIPRSEFATWKTSKLTIPAYFGNYLDFVSSYKLYLPYYGFIDLDPNDVVGGTVEVCYNINLFSGMANIVVACNNSRTGNAETKCYTVTTTIGEAIPFGADMWKSMGLAMSEQISKAAGQLIGAYANGNAVSNAISNAGNLENNSRLTKKLSSIDPNTDEGQKKISDTIDAEIAKGNKKVARTETAVNIAKAADNVYQPVVSNPQRSSSFNDETGCLDELHPYVLITRPANIEPADYTAYRGLPSAKSVTLSTCNGFTQVAAVKPQSMAGAPKYVDEIIALLQAGVYL